MRTAVSLCLVPLILVASVTANAQALGSAVTGGSPGGPTSGAAIQLVPGGFGSGRAPSVGGPSQEMSVSSASEEVDPFQGVLVKTVHLPLPPGRNGLQPSADLIYNSRGGNGLIGVGWGLDLPEIVANSTKFTDDEPGRFLIRIGASTTPLVQIATTANEAEFRLFNSPLSPIIKKKLVDGHWVWERLDNNGFRFAFGEAAESRIEVRTREEWALTSITDAFGNSIRYQYSLDHGVILPQLILYNLLQSATPGAGGATCGGHQEYNDCVEFAWIGRTDQETIFKGSPATVAVRLGGISVRSGGHAFATYQMYYGANQSEYSAVSGRSLLKAVKLVGADGDASRIVATFSYNDGSTSITVGTPSMGASATLFDPTWRRTPVNGVSRLPANDVSVVGKFVPDGLASVLYLPENGVHEWRLLRMVEPSPSIQSESWKPGPDGRWSYQIDISLPGLNVHAREIMPVPLASILGDFTGDGLTDLANPIVDFQTFSDIYSPLFSHQFELYYSSGNGWSPSSHVWQHAPPLEVRFQQLQGFTTGAQCRVGYFNRDSKADIACVNGWHQDWWMLPSTGNGFTFQQYPGPTLPPRDTSAVGYPTCFAGDVNGDGLTDLLCAKDNSYRNWSVAITGASPVNRSLPDDVAGGCLVGDVNGDGLADLVCRASSGAIWRTYYSDGSAWSPGIVWNGPPNPRASDCQLMDTSGTGHTDLVCRRQDNRDFIVAANLTQSNPRVFSIGAAAIPSGADMSRCFFGDFMGTGTEQLLCSNTAGNASYLLAPESFPDSLIVSADEYGNQTSYEYRPAASTENCVCAAPVKVITAVHHKESQLQFDKKLTYSNGFFDAEQKEFRGFGHVRVETPQGNPELVEYWYYQGDTPVATASSSHYARFAGMPYRTVVSAASGRPAIKHDYEYTSDAATVPPFQVALRRSVVTRYDCSNPTCAGIADEITWVRFDHRGQIVSELSGDPESSSAAFTMFEYEPVNDGTSNSRLISQTSFIVCGAASDDCDKNEVGPELIQRIHDDEPSTAGIVKAVILSAKKFGYQELSCDGSPVANGRALYVPSQVSTALNFPSAWSTEKFTFDSNGNLTCTMDANQHRYEFSYDDADLHLVKSTAPTGDSRTTEYSRSDPTIPAGLVVSRAVNNQNSEKYKYDQFGRLIETSYPDKYSIKREYTSNPGLKIKETNSYNDWVETSFDGEARPTVVRANAPSGTIASEIRYSPTGQVLTITSPHFESSPAKQTAFAYDELGRTAVVQREDGSRVLQCYNGRTMRTIDGNGHVGELVFDLEGNVLSVAQFSADATDCTSAFAVNSDALTRVSYSRDAAGRLKRVDDGHGAFVTYDWDQRGRIVRVHENGLSDKTITYDAEGLPVTLTGFDSNRIEMKYDRADRLVEKIRYNGNEAIQELSASYVNNSATPWLPTSLSWPFGVVTFQYDQLGRLVKTAYDIKPNSGSTEHYEIGATHLPGGRVSSIKYPDGSSVTYTYVAGMVSDISQANNSIWGGDYDAEGRIVRQHFGNGVSRTTSYSDIGLPTEIVDRDSTNTVLRAENRDYDASGNVTARTVDGVKMLYKYDRADRLLSSVLANTGVIQESLTYDINDNLLSSGPLGAYGYEGAKHPHAVQKIQNTQLTYDDFGRATSLFHGGVRYTEEGVKISRADGGSFTLKSAPFAGVLTVSPDGCGSSGSIHCTTEVQLNGLANCLKLKDCEDYIYGPEGLIAVSSSAAGSVRYQHTDFLGSLVLTTDTQGQPIEKYDYGVFGSRSKQPKTSQRFLRVGFAGMFEIAGADMYWTPNRLYDPVIGRFLSPDPQPDDGSASRLSNRYAYARNNPMRFRDPLGLQTPGGTVTYDYPWYPTQQSGGGWDPGGTMAPNFGWEKPRYYGDVSVGRIPLTTGSGGSQVTMPTNMSAYNGVLRPENDAIEQSWDFFDVWFAVSGIRSVFAGAKSLIATADYTLDELPDVLIKTEHGSGRLAKLGLSDSALTIESEIDKDVTQRWLKGLLREEHVETFGPIQVDGIPIRYHAIIRQGRIEVGTYYVPR